MKKNMLKVIFFFLIVAVRSFSIIDDEINEIFQIESSKNKELILEQEVRTETFDPVLVRDTYSKRLIDYLYQQLFKIDENGNVENCLLEKSEWKDKTKLYCILKDDIYFYNGDKITAYDVKASIEDFIERSFMNMSYDSIKKVKVINDREFYIILKYPDVTLERALTNPIISIIKRVDGKILGSGIYYVAEEKNKAFLLKKNKYYKEEKYDFESVEVRGELNSYQRILNSMKAHKYITYDLYKEDIEKAKEIGAITDRIKIEQGNIFDIYSLLFGNNYEYSLDEKKAIESIIDRDIETVYPEKMFLKIKGLNENKFKLSKLKKEYSLEKSREIIKKNNLDKRKIEIMCLNTIHSREMANKVIRELEKEGLQVELKIYDLNKFMHKLRSKDYDIAVYNITISSKYLGASLEKILIGDLASEELHDSIGPFISLMKQSKSQDEAFLALDKILSLIYSGRYFIPIEHKETYILGEGEVIQRVKK